MAIDLSVSGLASGFDWKTLVDQLAEVERTPERRLQLTQSNLQQVNNAYASLNTQLGVLKNRVDTLQDPTLFNSRIAKSGDATIASAIASEGAAIGTYTFAFSQLATAAAQQGAVDAAKPLNPTNDVSGLVISSASFATGVTCGTFTVSGKQVTFATSDSLQQVFDKISTATSGGVTGSYDAATDRISLSSSSAIVLGSATDTSNFLQIAKLYNNGTTNINSNSPLGAAPLSNTLANANLWTSISDGGNGLGEFKINGVSIAFNASTDSMADTLARINNSTAGVTASYDSVNDRFTLTNKTTGDIGVALEDVTGNFLAATKLSSGTLQRGNNLFYTINGGGQIISQSNTISEATSGLTGLTVTALVEGKSTTVDIASDSVKIKAAIADFITEYNKTQSLIDTQTASSTDAKGKVTIGLLGNEPDASDIASRLRSQLNADVAGLFGTLRRLEGIGYVSNGNDNSLTLGDSAKLDSALANDLNGVKSLFTDSTHGLTTGLSSFLDKTIGDGGALNAHQDNITKQISAIDTQISDQERFVLSIKQKLTDSFVAMERAQARMTQQLAFLTKNFG